MTTKKKSSIPEAHLTSAERAMKEARWFDAERDALSALDSAIQSGLHTLAADAILPLQEARRQRVLMAIDASDGSPNILDEVDSELESVEPGVHLLVPHAVAADARRMRIVGLQTGVPILTVCREPRTAAGQVPIVAIGEVTIRAYVDPPEDPDHHSMEWTLAAMESLGDTAIERAADAGKGSDRIVALRNALDSIPEHEKLHQALAEALRSAAG
ncbi:MAG: hypothetical protein CMJ34_04400 [Phycisphaerae bacterium]|nr:hypothetical protein [Phycisphaerae bacterium]